MNSMSSGLTGSGKARDVESSILSAEPEVNMSKPPSKSAVNMIPVKYLSLVLLTLQNTALILVMRYTRTRNGDMFLASTAVVMSEACKLFTCVSIITYQEGSFRKFLKLVKEDIIDCPLDCLKVSVPSIVYIVQNNLLYLAVSNLDAATFQVTYQLKILTTAVFSVFMLKKELAKLQWLSLVVLFIGVSIVQMQPPSSTSKSGKLDVIQNQLLGLVAVIISCVLSGFAGVYFEKILKGTRQSVWIRNIQLSVLGVAIGLVTMAIKDGTQVHEKGFYFGYTWIVWVVIFLQSFGGLVVAVVVKYADNILKGFATSASIVLSCIVSIYLFNFQLSLHFSLGAIFVILAVYMYSKFVPASPPKSVAKH